jgi:hypothetical protein
MFGAGRLRWSYRWYGNVTIQGVRTVERGLIPQIHSRKYYCKHGSGNCLFFGR